MTKGTTKKWRIGIGTVAGAAILFLILHLSAHYFLRNALASDTRQSISLDYKDASINLFTGCVTIRQPKLGLNNKEKDSLGLILMAERLQIEGFEYLDFIMNKNITVDLVHLKNPVCSGTTNKNKDSGNKDSLVSPKGNLQDFKNIRIHKVTTENGALSLTGGDGDTTIFKMDSINLEVYHLHTNAHLLKNKIPFSFRSYHLGATNSFIGLGRYESMEISKLIVTEENLEIEDLKLSSIYDRKGLSKVLQTQRDYVGLRIPKIVLDSFQFKMVNDTLSLGFSHGAIYKPDLNMFRDKLVPENQETKKLYGAQLKALPIYLSIPSLQITNGKIAYSELVEAGAEAGKIFFNDVNATLSNIDNTPQNHKRTKIVVKAALLGQAPIALNWSFTIRDAQEDNKVSGSLFDFNTTEINGFLNSNLNAKAKGTIDEMYFSFAGNTRTAQGQMKIKYSDFEFKVLQENGLKVNKFLTAIGNIFVSDGSKSDAQGYRYGTIETERDRQKSFFNYLWLNVRNGLLSAFTGNGKKKD